MIAFLLRLLISYLQSRNSALPPPPLRCSPLPAALLQRMILAQSRIPEPVGTGTLQIALQNLAGPLYRGPLQKKECPRLEVTAALAAVGI